MGKRFLFDRLAKIDGSHEGWLTCTWGNKPKVGRFWKRRLSKTRRRAWRDPHQRGLRSAESECNYKNW